MLAPLRRPSVFFTARSDAVLDAWDCYLPTLPQRAKVGTPAVRRPSVFFTAHSDGVLDAC